MRMVTYKCQKCGRRFLTTADAKPQGVICIACRKKQGLLNRESRLLQKELERLLQGKELSRNHKKGMLLEMAVSKTLDELGIPHDHNPFDITYPCFQEDNPDIVIEKLDTIIECKNLNKVQTDHLALNWLNDNVVERPKVSSYEDKIVVFGYKPRLMLTKYLKTKGWRTCAVGSQILTQRQAHDAIPRLKQQLDWLREELKAREELPFYTTE